MLILALDTSGDICSVALFDGGRELSTLRFRHERALSERLPGAVEFLLRDRGVTLRDAEGFAVGLGPGSFTGVRVGVTLAKTWAHVLLKPLVGVSSLDALASTVPALPGVAVAAVAPTRRTEVVAAFYHAGEAIPRAAPAVTANVEVVVRARAMIGDADAPLLIVGEAAAVVRKATEHNGSVIALPTSADAAAVARLAAARLLNGESDDVFALAPLYVTPPAVRGPDGKQLPGIMSSA